MPTTDTILQQPPTPVSEITRPLYVRRMPLAVWNRIHINAIKSQMRLQQYLVRILATSKPVPACEDDPHEEEHELRSATTIHTMT